MELVTPKIIELDISGELINKPFPLIEPMRNLLNKHVLCVSTTHNLGWSLQETDMYFGVQTYLDTVKEIMDMPAPERLGGGTIWDYFQNISPAEEESPADVDEDIMRLVREVFQSKEMYFLGVNETQSSTGAYDLGTVGVTGISQLDNLGRLLVQQDGTGLVELPFLYDTDIVELLDGRPVYSAIYSDLDVYLKLDFLVKTECSGKTMYVYKPITGFPDDGKEALGLLRAIAQYNIDVDIDLMVNQELLMSFESVNGNYQYYISDSDVKCGDSNLLTEKQAKELYPDYFPAAGLQATKRNSIRVF